MDAFVANHFRNFGTPKYCIHAETQVLHLFTCLSFSKCYKRQPNINFGPMV
jgi:hypothetical protein